MPDVRAVNVRIPSDLKDALDKAAATYRTTVTELIKAYAEYLRDGGKPIGYPNSQKGDE